MARGALWRNQYKKRDQTGGEEFNSEVADMTGTVDLVEADVDWLQDQIRGGSTRARLRIFGCWVDEPSTKRRLEIVMRPFRSKKNKVA